MNSAITVSVCDLQDQTVYQIVRHEEYARIHSYRRRLGPCEMNILVIILVTKFSLYDDGPPGVTVVFLWHIQIHIFQCDSVASAQIDGYITVTRRKGNVSFCSYYYTFCKWIRML